MDLIKFYVLFFFLANIYVLQVQKRKFKYIFWALALDLPPLGRIFNWW